MRDKFGGLNGNQQFLCKGLSSLNSKRFNYLYACSCNKWEGRTAFSMELTLENSTDSYLSFQVALLHSDSFLLFLY